MTARLQKLLVSALLVALLVAARIPRADASASASDAEQQREEQLQQENLHPFVEFKGVVDGSWTTFFIIVVASSRLGTLFPKLGLPLITGYMLVGVICGPYVLQMLSVEQGRNLDYVTTIALAFIALSAGSELYLPDIRDLFRPIMWMTATITAFVMVMVTLIIVILRAGGFVDALDGADSSCVSSIAGVAAAIFVSFSPASAIAIVRELRAKGQFTSLMLGLTVVADVIVIVLYTLTSSIAMVNCEGRGFEFGAFLLTILCVVAAIGMGYVFGKVLIFLVWLPIGQYFIIPVAFLTFLLADWFAAYSLIYWHAHLDFDALLICIVGGYVVTNHSRNRMRFMILMSKSSPYIFIPFFTKVGLQLNLPVLLQSLVFGFVVFVVRTAAIALGGWTGGHIAKSPKDHKNWIWAAQLTQAGVSLGLASRVAKNFTDIGPPFQTTIISVILISQIFGPGLCKWSIKKVGEDGKGEEMDEHGHAVHKTGEAGAHTNEAAAGAVVPHEEKRCLIFGSNKHGLAVAQRLLKDKWTVVLFDVEQSNLNEAFRLEFDGKHRRRRASGFGAELLRRASLSSNKRTGFDGSEMKDSPSTRPVAAPAPAPASPNAAAREAAAAAASSSAATTTALPAAATAEANQSTSVAINADDDERLQTRLLTVSADLTLVQSFDALAQQMNLGKHNVTCACLALEADRANYDLALYLIEKLKLTRVVARVFNPRWANLFSWAGVIPLSPFSNDIGLLTAAITSTHPTEIVLGGDKPGAATAAQSSQTNPKVSLATAIVRDLIIADTDGSFAWIGMPHADKSAFIAAHPDPTTEDTSNPFKLEKVNFNATVPEHMRDEHLSHLDHMRNFVSGVDQSAQKAAHESFLGPSALASMKEKEKPTV